MDALEKKELLKKADDLEVNGTEEKAEDKQSETLDFGEKKKKKKKKEKKVDESDVEGEVKKEKKEKSKKKKSESVEDLENPDKIDFGEKTKKKKKKRPDLADFESQQNGQGLGHHSGLASSQELEQADGSNNAQLSTNGSVDQILVQETKNMSLEEKTSSSRRAQPLHSYKELLDRVFGIIRQHNPELAGEKKRYTISLPQVHREGSKKTVFANLADVCARMHRTPEHVIQYIFAELGTNGSVDGSQRLVIKGKFQQKQIENVLKRYIMEYVTCQTCKSPDTTLTKQNRMYFLHCESCGSSRSVAAIKTGFQAQTMRRAVLRAAAQ